MVRAMDDPSEGDVEMGGYLKQTKGEMHDRNPKTLSMDHDVVSDIVISDVLDNSARGKGSEMDASAKGKAGSSNSHISAKVEEQPKPKWVDYRKQKLKPEPRMNVGTRPRDISPEATDSSDLDVPPNAAAAVGDGGGNNIPEPTFVGSMRQQLQINTPTVGGAGSCCIYQVPHTLLRVDEEAYTPVVVALGPLRQPPGYVTMKTVQGQKWRYLQEALSPAGDVGLVRFLQEIKSLEQIARECYSEAFDDIDSNGFVQMMVLDGCFVLQILLKETRRRPFSSDDPIFQQRWLFHNVKRDLMLLQNQIPFSLLERLFALLAPSMGITDSLLTVVQDFFQDRMKGPSRLHNPMHLLHLLHANLFPDVDVSKLKASVTNLKPFPGATHLLEAGVEFSSSATDRLDITFHDGVVKIPHLTVEDGTKSLFLNLIAFEQLHPRSRPHVTAYTFFMHCLINTAEDVSILCRKGVIDNWLGSDQEVADLFGELGRNITIYPNEVYMADVIGRIHEYRSKRLHAWRADFIHNYVRKPWAIVSLTAAIILLILTLIQTFFSMFSYFKPPS